MGMVAVFEVGCRSAAVAIRLVRIWQEALVRGELRAIWAVQADQHNQ